MLTLNNKIRNGIANSYKLRELSKDSKITQKKSFELNELAKENDNKIMFYKKLSHALKEIENEEYKNVGKKSL